MKENSQPSAVEAFEWDPIGDIIAFHEKFGLAYHGKPRALTGELLRFRGGFHVEEALEWADEGATLEARLDEGSYEDADVTHHLEMQLDAILDELYVILGTAHMQGFTREILIRGWSRVHAANMAKVRAECASDSKRGSTFDVVKPAGWEAPRHADLVEDHAHRTRLLPPPGATGISQQRITSKGPNTQQIPRGFISGRFNASGDTFVGVDYGRPGGDYTAETTVERQPNGDLYVKDTRRIPVYGVGEQPNIRPVSPQRIAEAVEPLNEALANTQPLCSICRERHDHLTRCGEFL